MWIRGGSIDAITNLRGVVRVDWNAGIDGSRRHSGGLGWQLFL